MRIAVKIKLKAKEEKVEKIDLNNYIVSVRAQPIEGKANQAIIKLLAEYFSTSKSNVKIVSGEKFKEKIIEIKERNE